METLDTTATPPTVGRFAPSPSGRMHLGNALSALLAWLGARSAGGSIVMRVEDLDPRCQRPDVAQQLMEDLIWLGLDWDGDPVYQRQRTDAYEAALATLTEQGLTYPCFCTRAELHTASAPHASDGTYVYAGTCRNLTPEQVAEKRALRAPALRLRVPEASDSAGFITVPDLIQPPCEQTLATDVGDFLVRRSDGVFAYQLAVVVDDAAQGVTQVVRGRDLLGSAPRQRYLQRLLGLPEVDYAHVPLLVAPDGRRLSKRDRDLDLGALRAEGVAPEAIVGALASAVGLLEKPEPLRPDELLGGFAWSRVRHDDVVADADFMAGLLSPRAVIG
ncbi:tRNA glutamyl-Q(34) synthetase GluQRS [Olsenella sp. YH-ols2217]|uniref:Glutamyl-Q tRNA(Asp) synthetase n=1 Tax=Kribbibacterium absianum TaxID=3044210 RepID=A0ABT6ZJV4_9ACTN|nr:MULTISPECIES: tRNA glutamyl-Q(34) synthetase GluQRS [unclassified Olsenella]MDJ1122427.1 tRNA glutamyl-Q(34) synthetase GluQRS [Olsenella sp. YH-ols2216]MDJ1129319.1 tRNA glutamyl-Q(34) synthetase GluQRS [Olsenella sp. YH-ols2217]